MTDPRNAPHAAWVEPAYSAAVEFSPAALERLRQDAIEGLLAVPRVGMGVGGFLIGSRGEGVLRIYDHLPIPCSHASGPSFRLTDVEHEQALEMSKGSGVVGWYLTRTSAPFAPDLDLYAALCPEPWQVMVLIRPSAEETSTATLVFRDESGAVVIGTDRELADASADDDEGFSPVRIFGLVPSSGNSTRRVVVEAAAPVEPAGEAEGPYGFQPAAGVKLTGKRAPARVPSFDPPAEPIAYEPISTVRFMGGKKVTASRQNPDLEALLAAPIAEPEERVEVPPLALPEGPIEFEPVRRILMADAPAAPGLVRPVDEASLRTPDAVVGFEPTRRNMFVGEVPEYKPRPVSEPVAVEAAPISPFLEPLPERNPDPPLAPGTEGEEGFAAVRSAAFMTHEEKIALRNSRLAELEPEPPASKPEKEPLSPEAARRRKLIFRGAFAAVIAAAAYSTREIWLPAPLKLELTESNSHVTALWNAEILDPGATGLLTVTDGAETTATKLSADKLAGGVFGFDRKTPNVSATLQVDGKTVTATLQTGNR